MYSGGRALVDAYTDVGRLMDFECILYHSVAPQNCERFHFYSRACVYGMLLIWRSYMFIQNIYMFCNWSAYIWYVCAITSTYECWDSDSRWMKTRMPMCYFRIPATRKAANFLCLERCCVNSTAWHAVCDMHDWSWQQLFSIPVHREQQWDKMLTARLVQPLPKFTTSMNELETERLVQQMSLAYSGSVGSPIMYGGLPLFVVWLLDVVRLIFLIFLLCLLLLFDFSLHFLLLLLFLFLLCFPLFALGDATQTPSCDPARNSARQLWKSSADWHGAPDSLHVIPLSRTTEGQGTWWTICPDISKWTTDSELQWISEGATGQVSFRTSYEQSVVF